MLHFIGKRLESDLSLSDFLNHFNLFKKDVYTAHITVISFWFILFFLLVFLISNNSLNILKAYSDTSTEEKLRRKTDKITKGKTLEELQNPHFRKLGKLLIQTAWNYYETVDQKVWGGFAQHFTLVNFFSLKIILSNNTK